MRLAKPPRVNIGVKIPSALNEYLDRYVREAWPEKIQKQDLITRGIQLVIMEIETGEKLADLD